LVLLVTTNAESDVASAHSTLLPDDVATIIPPVNSTTTLGWTLFKQCDSRWEMNSLELALLQYVELAAQCPALQ